MVSIANQLHTLGALLKTNLETKGIDGLTGNEGLTTLANKILDISSGSCDSLTLIGLPQIIQKDETSHIGAKLIVSGSPVVNETIYFNIKPPEKYCADYNSFSQLFTENSLGGRGYKSKDKIIQFTASGDTEISFISETMGNPYLTQALGKGEYIITFYDSPFQLFEVINGEAVYINSISTPSGDVWFDFEKNSSNDNVTNIRIRERITITSAKTDKNGIATIPYVGTGKGMMTVEANYYKDGGIFLQETYEVYDCQFYDIATTNNKNTYWRNNNAFTVSVTANGSHITEITNNGELMPSNTPNAIYWGDRKLFDIPIIVQMEISDITNYLRFVVFYNNKQVNSIFEENGTYTFNISSEGITKTVNGITTTLTTDSVSGQVSLGFVDSSASSTGELTFKNFMVYPI